MTVAWNNRAVQITCEGLLLGQQYINRFYVAKQGEFTPWTAEEVQEATAKAAGMWELSLAPLLSTELEIRSIRGRVMNPDLAIQFINGVSITGEDETQSLPNNVAACVSLSSGFAGRAGRGRMFIGGLTRAVVQENNITQAFAEDLENALQSGMIVRFSETGTVPMDVVIYSQYTNRELREVAVLTPVTSVFLSDRVVDSQRRRLPGRGA